MCGVRWSIMLHVSEHAFHQSKNTFLPSALHICFFLYVHVSTSHMLLCMEACLDFSVLSQSAQSIELWANWQVVRRANHYLIFTLISLISLWFLWTWGSSEALLLPEAPLSVISRINNYDQGFWWMDLSLPLTIWELERWWGWGFPCWG